MQRHPRARFGVFELDADAGELRKQGIRIKLHEKPLEVLLALLEHPGEVVTRKQLQQRLWPSDTFIEFENGLNNAMSRLREALGDAADNPRFIETIPRRGYRFLPEVSQPQPSLRGLRVRRWILAVGITLGASLAIGVGTWLLLGGEPQNRSLVVLPFRNLGSGSNGDYFADGMTDAITTELAKLGVAKVISETSAMQFKNTKKPIREIAGDLGVQDIVEGTVLREGDHVRITVQLIRADTDRHIWAESYQREMSDILRLQNEVALGVARGIDRKLAPKEAGSASPRPADPEAYDAYLKGRYYLQKGSEDAFARAKGYFEQAIHLDPSYASAYTGLSDYYVLTDSLPPEVSLPEAREYSQKAVQLDETLPDSHASLGYVYFYADWNWPAAEKEFRRAIELNAGLVRTHRWYALYLAAMGRDDEALAEAQRAIDLDPLSISAHDAAATSAIWCRQYDRSIVEGQKIFELDPNDPRGYEHMAVGHFREGMYRNAVEEAEKGLALSHRDPNFISLAAYAYGRLGEIEQASELVAELRAAGRERYVPPYFMATALVGMDKRKEAVDALEKGFKVRDPYLVFLQSTAWFDPLRSDSRFQDLLRRMNFPR